MKFQAKNSRGL